MKEEIVMLLRGAAGFFFPLILAKTHRPDGGINHIADDL